MVKRILVVGMIDSIHLARWLNQFKNESLEFTIFPSKKYRLMHRELYKLSNSSSIATYIITGSPRKIFRIGHLDFLSKEILGFFFKTFNRKSSLQRILKHNSFDLIHAIEIQGAGYLIGSIDKIYYKNSRVILTNWGSDIYYFARDPKHLSLIKSLLGKVDEYSAECERDYHLARSLGFVGHELPCIPNSGGFDTSRAQNYVRPSMRKQIIIKGYGGIFGRPDILAKIIEKIYFEFPTITFFIYSVTEDTLKMMRKFPKHLKKRIRYSTVRHNLSRHDLMSQFLKSRIYIGCSESDGISTSFLEAMISGTYPIQTNTSCAQEWIDKGAIGSVVPLDAEIIMNHVRNALSDESLVDSASDLNFQVCNKFLSKEYVSKLAKQFYMNL